MDFNERNHAFPAGILGGAFTWVCLKFLERKFMNAVADQTGSGVALVHVVGSLTMSGERLDLCSVVSGLLDQGFTKVILDLRGVREVDVSGIEQLGRCRMQARARGAEFQITNLVVAATDLIFWKRFRSVFCDSA